MRNTVSRIFVHAAVLGLGLCLSVSAAAAPTWTLTWSDDFVGGNGAVPDPTRWTYDLGGGGWGNGELETYTNSTANSYQDGNGHLVIQALNSGGYSSARLKTQTLFEQAYGRVEASIQLPAGTAQGSGLWPAFWMLGSNINNVSWPSCGEIDIMENIGQYNTATQNLGHIHGPVAPANGDYYGGQGVGGTFNFPAGQAMNTAFHLYAVEWSPTAITYYVDNTAYLTVNAASLPAGGQWVFNHPFFIILNLAIGGGVGGPVGASFPQQMLVDYVRVYKLTSNGTSPYGGSAAAVPGTIQAENYDSYNDASDPAEPGEGFAYNAKNSTQTNGVFRTGDAVSTEACGDAGGTYDCDYTSPGQWMQYTINVAQAGSYTLTARVASSGAGGSFHFDVDGAAVTGELTCPNTGGWQSYQDVVATGVNLTTGTHQLLLVEDSMGAGNLGVCNFNYFTLSLPSTATPVATNTPVPTATPSETGTPSKTASPTPTRTASPSATASPLPTRTSSPTSIPSATATRTASSTPTKTNTQSNTEVPTATSTWTPSPAGTKTATPTNTGLPTATPTWTASPVATKTATPTNTGLPTATPTWTASPIATKTATPTNTSVPTATASWTASAEATKTATAANTGAPTATPTPSETGTGLPTATALPTHSPVPSATSSPNPMPSASPSPQEHGRRGGVVQVGVGPNPSNGAHVTLYVDLDGTASLLQVTVFSPADVLVLQTQYQGQFQAGWNKVALPPMNLPNGLYFVRVQAGLATRIAKLMILR